MLQTKKISSINISVIKWPVEGTSISTNNCAAGTKQHPARGVARGGRASAPPEQRMTKKFSPLFLKRPIKKLTLIEGTMLVGLHTTWSAPQAKNPSYAPAVSDSIGISYKQHCLLQCHKKNCAKLLLP